MSDRSGKFAGDDPFALARSWLAEADGTEPNDPNAIALSTVDAEGLPNVRMVLLKEIEADAFVFYTNYGSAKGQEIAATGKAAFVWHSKTLRRQIRVRGLCSREDGAQADAYYASRSLKSRLGAWASDQSQPLSSRAALVAEVAKVTAQQGTNPARPPFWGGFRLHPVEIEFWADGAFRLHDRFRWTRGGHIAAEAADDAAASGAPSGGTSGGPSGTAKGPETGTATGPETGPETGSSEAGWTVTRLNP